MTEHGRPTATEELVRAGVLRAPERGLDEELWRLPRPDDADGLARRALLDERRSGR